MFTATETALAKPGANPNREMRRKMESKEESKDGVPFPRRLAKAPMIRVI